MTASNPAFSQETFYFCGKIDDNTSPEDASDLIPPIFQEFPDTYTSHSTQSFTLEECLYFATSFTLNVPLVRAKSDEDIDILHKSLRQVSESKKKNRRVCYECRDDYLVSNKSEEDYTHRAPGLVGCFLQTDQGSLRIKDVETEEPPSGIRKQEASATQLKLDLKYKYSENFSYPLESTHDIIVSNSNLADFYQLRFQDHDFLTDGPVDPSLLEIDRVNVRLYSVIKFLDLSTESGPRVIWGKDHKHIVDWKPQNDLVELSRSADSTYLNLPSRILDSRIDDFGPSFVSMNIKRRYFLRFTLNVTYKSKSEEIEIIRPVEVASKAKDNSVSLLTPLTRTPPCRLREAITCQEILGAQNDIMTVAETCFGIFNDHDDSTRSWNETMSLSETLFAISAYFSMSEKNSDSDSISSSLQKSDCSLVSTQVARNCEASITCLCGNIPVTAKEGVFHEVRVGPFLNVKDKRIPITMPLHGSVSNTSYRWYIKHLALFDKSIDLRIHFSPLKPDKMQTFGGACILIPGKKLGNFARFRISYEEKLTCLARLRLKLRGLTFIIQEVNIEIEEEFREKDKEGNESFKTKVYSLCTSRCTKQIDFLQNGVKPGRENTNSAWKIPRELYDERIPNIEPTLFTSSSSRVHWLQISIMIRVTPSQKEEKLYTKFPIQVAERMIGEKA